MKRSYRKFFGIVLLLASLAAGPVLAYWGRAQAAGSYLGMVAGAAAYQNRLLYPADAGLRPAVWPVEETSPPQPQGDEPLPVRRMIPVKNILQLPQLPNGCEATALAIVLQYYGYDADKMDLAYQYIPRQEFSTVNGRLMGGDPANVYPGDPAGWGYYCMPKVVTEAAARYLGEYGSERTAINITGASQQDLQGYLAVGAPVLVWKTIDDQPPRPSSEVTWHLYDTGEFYHPYANLHVVVLCGYDEDVFYISDPQGRQTSMPIDEFMENFRQTGRRAMTVIR